jgi:hypothetical protein
MKANQTVPADSTFLAMIRMIIVASQMLTQTTEIAREFRTTITARMTKLNKT